MPTFAALAQAAYCRRKLFYRRQENRTGPMPTGEADRLARQYPALIARTIEQNCLATDPESVSRALATARDRFPLLWPHLLNPSAEDLEIRGRQCHGRVSKLLACDPPTVTIVTGGKPPSEGVWHHQTVRAVAASLALAAERGVSPERALVEYPRHGVIRSVPIDSRRRAAYRRTLEAVRSLGEPPPRTENDAKCRSCEYRQRCRGRTRSLRSLLP